MSESMWKKEIHFRKPKPEKQAEAALEPKSEPVKAKRFSRKREPLPPFPTELLESSRACPGTVVAPVVPIVEPAPSSDPVQPVERWPTPRSAPMTFPRAASPEPQPTLLPPPPAPEPLDGQPPEPQRAPEFSWASPAAEPAQTLSVWQPSVDQPAPAYSWSQPTPEPAFLVAAAQSRTDELAPTHSWSQPTSEPAPVFEPSPPASSVSLPSSDQPAATPGWLQSAPEVAPVFEPPVEASPSPVWSFAEPSADESRPTPGWSQSAPEVAPVFEPPVEASPSPAWSFSEPSGVEPAQAYSPPQAVPVSHTDVPGERVGFPQITLAAAPVVEAATPDLEPVAAASAAEPGPVAEKTPLLKREISFKRKPKQSKAVKAPKDKKERAAEARTAEKTPLLKREISFKRKPKQSKAVKAPKEQAAKAPTAEKTPLLKREISLRRKPSAERPAQAQVESTAEKESAERTSLLKRQISLKRKPKGERPAKHPRSKSNLKRGRKGDHRVTRVVGLRIGSTQLAAAHVQNNGTHELVQLARSPLERGVIVAGEVRDADTLTRALKEFFATNKLPRKDVRLGIASNRIGVRVIDVPMIDDPRAFENALRFRAQEVLPIPVTDAILDHVPLEDVTSGDGEAMKRVLLVFAHRELVNRYVDVCRGAGVRLLGIDLDAFALLRALTVVGATDGSQAVVGVAIGHERTVLAVSDGRVCDFTRVLEWGGSSLDIAVARALNLTPSQAEPVKQMLDLESDTPPEGVSPVQFEAAKAAVKGEIGALGRELVSSLRFYQSRDDSLALGELLLAGGGAQLGGLPEELNRLLGMTVRVADPLANVTLNRKVNMPDGADAASLAIAVGLGIEV